MYLAILAARFDYFVVQWIEVRDTAACCKSGVTVVAADRPA